MNVENGLGLAIESAVEGGSLSIFNRRSGIELAGQIGALGKSKSEDLLENLSDLLKTHKISKYSIDLVVFVTGAGSLTGLKIGESTAKGLAKSFKCRYQAISLWDVFTEITMGKTRIFYIPAAKNRVARRISENDKFEENTQVFTPELFQEDLNTNQRCLTDTNIYIHEGLLDLFDANVPCKILNKNLAGYIGSIIASDNKPRI